MSRSVPQSEPPHGYKLTDLGYIPEDWSVTPLGQLVHSVEYGSSAKSDTKGEIPVLRMGNLQGGRIDWGDLVYTNNPREMNRYSLQDGDVLFNRTNTIDLVGKTSLYGGEREAIFAGYLIRIKVVGEHLDARFLNYILNTPFAGRHSIKVASLAVGQANINAQKLKTYPIPLPPTMKEQKAIAGALSHVDELIGVLEKLIAKKQAIKQAIMQQLLTGKTRLPGFTDNWETKRLGEVLKFQVGYPFSSKYFTSEVSGLRLVKNGDLKADDEIVYYDGPYADDYLVSNGDVLIGMDGDFLPCLWNKGEALLNQRVGRLRVKSRSDTRFAYYFLREPLKGIERATSSTTVKHLSHRDVEAIIGLIPEVDEQTAIATVLSDIDAEIETLERRLDKTRQIKQGMMQQLLTGRIRLVKPQAPSFQADAKPNESKPHSWAFNEAIVISTLAKHFGKEEFPLGRKRYTKLSYLLHRHVEKQAEGYLKKAAGPYNPKTKYGGPERIAVESGYVRDHNHGPYSGFVAANNIAHAESYFERWYGKNAIQWLEQFRFKKNDDLELLATVDMAVEELRAAGKDIDVPGVKAVIRSHNEWKAKLDREVFSDANIRRAIQAVGELFAEQG